jgi:hypothetical protein
VLLAFDSCWLSGGNIRRGFATAGNLALDPHQTGPSILQLGLYFCIGAERLGQAVGALWSANHGAILRIERSKYIQARFIAKWF